MKYLRHDNYITNFDHDHWWSYYWNYFCPSFRWLTAIKTVLLGFFTLAKISLVKVKSILVSLKKSIKNILLLDYSFSYLLVALKSCNEWVEFHISQFNGVSSKIVEQTASKQNDLIWKIRSLSRFSKFTGQWMKALRSSCC